MKLSISLVLIFSIVANCVAFSRLSGPKAHALQKFEPSNKAWKWADKQMREISVEEKVGQLIHIGVNAKFANQDSEYFKELKRQVVDNKIGGIIFFGAPI